MTKTLQFEKPHRLSRLMDELLAAGAIPPVVDRRSPLIGSGDTITVHAPDDADEAAIAAVVAAHDPTAIAVAEDAEQAAVASNLLAVKALAQSAVGVALADLTAGQVKALLAVLLWSHGAIGSGGRIRPLVEWAR